MAFAEWTEDDQYFIWTGDVRIPKTYDPTTKSAIILLGPEGGIAEIPALVKGDPGQPAEIDTLISFTALAWDDPTADSATFSLITPGTDSTPPVYRLALSLHRGAPGDPGTFEVLAADDVTGTAVDGYMLTKGTASGEDVVVWAPQKVGGQYWPASIANTSGSDGQNRTLASVSIPAQPFDWRPRVHGQAVISGTAATRVDLVARLDSDLSGDVVGRAYGQVGATPPTAVLVSGVPAGSASTVGLVAAGESATVYLRAEQQASTTDTYNTAGVTTSFMVEVCPV